MTHFSRFAVFAICLIMPYAASAQVIYTETFNASLATTTPSGADGSADWSFTNGCGANGDSGHSIPGAARWGNTGTCGDFGNSGDSDDLDTPVIDVSACGGEVDLSLNYFMEFQESCSYDRAYIQVSKNGNPFQTIASTESCGNGDPLANNSNWNDYVTTLTGVVSTLQVRFIAQTDDGIANSGQGFFVDDITIACLSASSSEETSLSAPDVRNEGGGAPIFTDVREEEPASVILDGVNPQLLVSSRDNSLVSIFGSGDGFFIDLLIPPTSGGLDQAQGLAFGPDGNLYVSSYETDSILRYDGSTGEFLDAFVQPTSGALDGPVEFVWGPDGNLYVASFVNDSVLRYNGTDGSFIDAFVTSTLGGLDGPEGLAFGPDNHLYVTSSETDAVLRYDGSTGAFIDLFVTPTLGGLDGPVSLSWGPDGNLYVSSFISDSILRYGPDGSFIDAFVSSTSGGLNGPVGQAWGPDGDFYVASFHNHAVARFDGDTGAPVSQFVTSTLGALDGPRGILFTNTTSGSTGGAGTTGETGGETTGGSGDSGGCSLIR